MTRIDQEMAHMGLLLSASPTFFLGWRAFLEDKARRLAAWDPEEYSQLPMQFAALAKKLESNHWPSKQRVRGTR